jgi:hypothetical protein
MKPLTFSLCLYLLTFTANAGELPSWPPINPLAQTNHPESLMDLWYLAAVGIVVLAILMMRRK